MLIIGLTVEQKQQILRDEFSECLALGLTLEQTIKRMNRVHDAVCDLCVLQSMGHTFCDTGKVCKVERTFSNIIRKAKEIIK